MTATTVTGTITKIVTTTTTTTTTRIVTTTTTTTTTTRTTAGTMTWKKKVSKSNVLLFQLQASVLGTKEKEFGLWATPTTMDVLPPRSKEATIKHMTTARKGRTKPGGLREQMDPSTMEMYGWMLPTPRVSDIEGGAAKNVKMENGHFYRENKKGERWGVKLRDVMEMYPTPRASAAMTEDMEKYRDWETDRKSTRLNSSH